MSLHDIIDLYDKDELVSLLENIVEEYHDNSDREYLGHYVENQLHKFGLLPRRRDSVVDDK